MFAIPVLILIGFIMFATIPVLLAEVNTIKSEHSGLINGIFMTLNFAIGALSLLLIGIFGDYLGLKTTYILSAFIGFGAIYFVSRLPKTDRV